LKLFNVKKDIGEQRDLSKELPQKVDLMHRRLQEYLQRVGAVVPRPNPNYDPDAPVRRMPPPGARRRRPGAGGRRRPLGRPGPGAGGGGGVRRAPGKGLGEQ